MALGVEVVGHQINGVVHFVLVDALVVAGMDRCLVAVILWDTEEDLLRDSKLLLLRFL